MNSRRSVSSAGHQLISLHCHNAMASKKQFETIKHLCISDKDQYLKHFSVIVLVQGYYVRSMKPTQFKQNVEGQICGKTTFVYAS